MQYQKVDHIYFLDNKTKNKTTLASFQKNLLTRLNETNSKLTSKLTP